MYKKVEVDETFLEYLEEVSFDLLREVKFYLGQGFKEVYLYDGVGLNVLIIQYFLRGSWYRCLI